MKKEMLDQWAKDDPTSIIIPPVVRPGSAGVPPARGQEARAPRKLAGVLIKAAPLSCASQAAKTPSPFLFNGFFDQEIKFSCG